MLTGGRPALDLIPYRIQLSQGAILERASLFADAALDLAETSREFAGRAFERTLGINLQETAARIRERTIHLTGLKIGIMGCIVNGPGEMADADYGYVGAGPDKVNLYKQKTVIRKGVASDQAVEQLIELIKENGDWAEPV